MFRLAAASLLAILVLAACGDRLNTREKVQEAIIQRLQQSSGLNLKDLDVTTTSVTFDKNLAYATVAFHSKSDPSVNSGMSMKYTLEKRSGKWAVVGVADSQGHGLAGSKPAGASQLPPGHPPLDGAAAGQTK